MHHLPTHPARTPPRPNPSVLHFPFLTASLLPAGPICSNRQCHAMQYTLGLGLETCRFHPGGDDGAEDMRRNGYQGRRRSVHGTEAQGRTAVQVRFFSTNEQTNDRVSSDARPPRGEIVPSSFSSRTNSACRPAHNIISDDTAKRGRGWVSERERESHSALAARLPLLAAAACNPISHTTQIFVRSFVAACQRQRARARGLK